MLRQYVKMTFRNLAARKTFSIINISGLALGLAVSYIILLYVIHENSYGSFHEYKDRLFRIITRVDGKPGYEAGSPYHMQPKLVEDYPGIESAVRLRKNEVLIRIGGEFIREGNLARADEDFFQIFSYPLRQGHRETALRDPYSIVLTESMALKYFGDEDPMGKIVSLRIKKGTRFDAKVYDLTVTGVMADFPSNSHVHVDFLIPMATIEWGYENINRKRAIPYYESWNCLAFHTYILLSETADPILMEENLVSFMETHASRPYPFRFELQPLPQIHLNRLEIRNEIEPQGSPLRITLFSAVAFGILLIAVINYVILSTARSTLRAKEVGVRKVVGANQTELIRQIMFESGLITLIAIPLSVGLVILSLPYLTRFLGTALKVLHLIQWQCIAGFLGIALLASVFSGAYIGFVLSAFRPVDVIHERFHAEYSKSRFRGVLVVIQITIFVILMIGAVIIERQVDYLINGKDLGFDRENIMSIPIHERNFVSSYRILKQEVTKCPDIEVMTCSQSAPPANYVPKHAYQKVTDPKTGRTGFYSWQSDSEEPREDLEILEDTAVDFGYVEALGLKIAAGRAFSEDVSSDRRSIMVNESFVKYRGIENPVGKTIRLIDENKTIIGVLKDYHTHGLYDEIFPMVLRWNIQWAQQIIVRVRGGHTAAALAFLKEEWHKLCPDSPFEYVFLDEYIENAYGEEIMFGHMIGVFSILAIVIAGLGLFGLAQFTAQQKTHEIGIRKVMGATVPSIVKLMLKGFIVVVLIANAISWPAAWFLTRHWLQDFAYRIDVNFFIFILTGAVTMFIALSTVIWQVVRAARVNPVESLRYE